MSNLAITIPMGLGITMDSLGPLSAVCTPLTTIHEEEEEEHNNITVTAATQDKYNSACEGLSAKSAGLSINMPLLSPTMSSSSPLSASYSSCSSAMSSPVTLSPVLSPFQWTSDIRQYIMADIGPQPSNSEVPGMRNQMYLPRRRSSTKLGGLKSPGLGWTESDGELKGLGLTMPSVQICEEVEEEEEEQ